MTPRTCAGSSRSQAATQKDLKAVDEVIKSLRSMGDDGGNPIRAACSSSRARRSTR